MATGSNRILSGLGAIAFATSATRERAARYRGRAKQLTNMMLSEPDSKLRGKLRELARRYRELADSTSGETE